MPYQWRGWRPSALTVVTALALGCALAGSALPATAVGYDYGDAPPEMELWDDPARALLAGLRLGSTVSDDRVDADTGASAKASESADGDDDDGVGALDPVPAGRLTTVTVPVALSGVTATVRLCGWLDFGLDRVFDPADQTCVDVPAGATTSELRWDGRAAGAGTSYLRLRIGSVAAEVEQPFGPSRSGEVEDHPVTFVQPTPPPRTGLSLVVTATPTRVSRLGERVGYAYRVRNTGDLPLTGLTVSDLRVPPAGLECSPALGATLAPGAELRCTATVAVTQDDLDFGALETAAEARAEAPSGATADPGDDVLAVGPATVEVSQRPQLTVEVTTLPERPGRGEPLNVAFGLRNTGNVTLRAVRPSGLRPDLDELVCEPPTPLTLVPGEGVSCSGSLVVGRADAARRRVAVRVGGRGEGPYGSTDTSRDDVTASTTVKVALTRDPQPEPDDPHRTSPPKAPARGTADPASDGGLADSGGPGQGPLVGGLLSMMAGAATLVSARRRRSRRARLQEEARPRSS
jgi:uncharacterized repeat protein (TIGR01451 family)